MIAGRGPSHAWIPSLPGYHPIGNPVREEIHIDHEPGGKGELLSLGFEFQELQVPRRVERAECGLRGPPHGFLVPADVARGRR